jgi:hypothetical protein
MSPIDQILPSPRERLILRGDPKLQQQDLAQYESEEGKI